MNSLDPELLRCFVELSKRTTSPLPERNFTQSGVSLRIKKLDGFPLLPEARIGAFIAADAVEPAHAFLNFFRDESPWIA